MCLGSQKYPKTSFRTEDGLSLSFPDNFFDKVYSIAVLHQIPSLEFRLHFLQQIKRVLKPGGLLVLTVWKFHQPREWYLLLKYTLLKIIGKSKLDWKDIFQPWGEKVNRFYHSFSSKELDNLVKKAGFEIKALDIAKNKAGNCCEAIFRRADQVLYIGNFLYRFKLTIISFQRTLFLTNLRSSCHI